MMQMSPNAGGVENGARDRLHLLQRVHPIFHQYLPTIQDVENGRFGSSFDADLADDVTILRSDFKSLPYKLRYVDLEQITSDAELKHITKAFDSVLRLFEESVLDGVTSEDIRSSENADTSSLSSIFPKLCKIHSLQQQPKTSAEGADCTDIANAKSDSTTLIAKQTPLVASEYIDFPPPSKAIASCRNIIERFSKDVDKVSLYEARGWNAESALEQITDTEIKFISEAQEFSDISSSLFSHLVNCITCQGDHLARLHLSGFHKRQMEMLLGTGEQGWISACFTHCATAPPTAPAFSHRICAHATTNGRPSLMIQGLFNGNAVWEECFQEQATCDFNHTALLPRTLDSFLPNSKHFYNLQPTSKISLKERKTIGVLLAYALFQLCHSPWLQQEFEGTNILILPSNPSLSRLDHWRPHISCALRSGARSRSLGEDVAALGVLILELEVNSQAEWTDDDEDYLTATRSNSARLFRILEEWKNDLSDHYCSVGWACFQFEELIEKFDHPEIGKSSKDLAILYKCILNPLFRRLVSDFGEADNLFQGVSALSVPTRQKRPTRLERLVLYDDQESSQPDKKSGYADELVKSLNDGFLGDIRALRSNFEANGLAETMTGKQVPRKIRIAVLDTGIDRKDKMIKAAMGRKIVETRSFVDDDCEDTYGHGTHVTRLLIAMAPSAEIYVAKITDNKHVDPEDMGRIAEAINYAVETWDVDIISMSFGFEIENPDIDDAIDDAFKADKLMFVAASNEGGNRGRSRLARSSSVICIHACDGKGNKGDMSPSPEKQTQNFTTLGVAVKSVWKGKTVYKSGTSFATPVAAAMTACVLEFANFKCDLTKRQRKKLYKREGMINVLGAMSIERDDYDYVQPEHLWDGKTESDIVGDIMRIVNK